MSISLKLDPHLRGGAGRGGKIDQEEEAHGLCETQMFIISVTGKRCIKLP